jgi:hypothetical protein
MQLKTWATVNLFVLIAVTFITANCSHAGWLIYHEHELRGRILDIDTKQPIEGAVVVVEYKKATIGLGAGTLDSTIDVRETQTNKDGIFKIPSYTTVIQPFSWQIPNTVIIFKPGYASLETLASNFIGQIATKEGTWPWSKDLKYRLSAAGLLELPRLIGINERRLHMPSPITNFDYEKQNLLIKSLNEERSSLGLDNYRFK